MDARKLRMIVENRAIVALDLDGIRIPIRLTDAVVTNIQPPSAIVRDTARPQMVADVTILLRSVQLEVEGLEP